MEIAVSIDSGCREPRIVIFTDRVTDEVEAIIKRLSGPMSDTIPVQSGRGVEIVEAGEIIRVFAGNKRVFIQTEKGTYPVDSRLYELEERLDGRDFVRISNSEIVNLRRIIKLDMGLTGTIRVHLRGGVETYVSRRNVARIKKTLGI